MRKKISFFVLLMMLPLSLYAEIYKWKGDHGEMHYSDVPPPGKVQLESLKTKNKAPSPPSVADTGKPKEATGLAPVAKNNAVKNDVIETETLESRQNRAKACEVAKANLAKLKAGGSIYRDNEKGERQYLDETTIKKEMEIAQKEVDATCPKS